jgi:hypothetical protein
LPGIKSRPIRKIEAQKMREDITKRAWGKDPPQEKWYPRLMQGVWNRLEWIPFIPEDMWVIFPETLLENIKKMVTI